jgi:hypothetical protein
MHHLDSYYLNAAGHVDGRDEEVPVEERGNMPYHGPVLRSDTFPKACAPLDPPPLLPLDTMDLVPHYQLSTDAFAGRLQNQTNLAVKGVLRIRAMAKLTKLAENQSDAEKLAQIPDAYFSVWHEYWLAGDRRI